MKERLGMLIDGKYRLLSLLGTGGMGTVYEAEHTLLRRKVAVKMLHADAAGPTAVERLLREAQTASSIGHPNITEVLDVGRLPGDEAYLVMEFLKGRSLQQLLDTQGALPYPAAVQITLSIISALRAAHEHGFLHRDIKPDNVFLQDSTEGARVKLLDFGLARLTTPDPKALQLTHTGAIIGTPYYMAPEQARGLKEIDEGVDIWATGVTLYQMLSGQRPFSSDNYNSLLFQIAYDPFPPLKRHGVDIPEGLTQVLQTALAKPRHLRYSHIEEMAHALSLFADSSKLPGAIHPPSALDDCPSMVVTPTPQKHPAPDLLFATTYDAVPSTRQSVDLDTSFAPLRSTVTLSEEPASLHISGWRKWLWFLVLLGLFALVVFGLMKDPFIALSALGLPNVGFAWSAVLTTLLCVAGLSWAGLSILQYWRSRQPNRWLHGMGFAVFPVVGLLMLLKHNFTLHGQLDLYLSPLRNYMDVSSVQVSVMSGLLKRSYMSFLGASTAVLGMIVLISMLVLLGHVFAPGGKSQGVRRPGILALLGMGLLMLSELFLFSSSLSWMGWFRFLVYGTWFLTLFSLNRQSKDDEVSCHFVLRAGALATLSSIGFQIAVGYSSLYPILLKSPKIGLWTDRAFLLTHIHQHMKLGAVVEGLLLLTLYALLLWRKTPSVVERKSKKEAGELWKKSWSQTALLVVVVGLPIPLCLSAMGTLYRQWLPHKISQMRSVSLKPGGPPSFYIDRQSASLWPYRKALWIKLTGRRFQSYDADMMVKALSGAGRCAKELKKTLSRPPGTGPALCLTAEEARKYCELQQKQLPSPKEWQAAFGGRVKQRSSKTKHKLKRGSFGEWVQLYENKGISYGVAGASGGTLLQPQRLKESFSSRIGFRCVYHVHD